MANRLKPRTETGPLNAVQKEILKRVSEGDTHGEIAESMIRSRVHVSENMSVAMAKMKAKNSHQACARYGRYSAYHNAAERVLAGVIKAPTDETEEHVNHVLLGLADELRATGDRLMPQ